MHKHTSLVNHTIVTTSYKLLAIVIIAACLLINPGVGLAEQTVVVIPKATILHFWKMVCTGAHDAIKNTDTKLIWRGPRVQNKSQAQQHLLQFYTEKKVDAIVLAPTDMKKLNPYIEKAVKAGIAIVIIDSPVTSNAPHTYIATDNYKSGEIGATLLSREIKRKGPVLLVGHTEKDGASFLRGQGFIDKMNKLRPGRSIIRIDMEDGSERETRIAVDEILSSVPSIAGIFSVDEPISEGVYHVLSTQSLDIPFIAFDYNNHLIQGLKDGRIKALITQEPYTIGFFGVRAAISLLAGKKVKKRVCPVTIITPNNISRSSILKRQQKTPLKEKESCPICFN